MSILVDTGLLYALSDAGDAWHGRARKWLEGNLEPLIVPVTVVPEVTYLLRERLGERAERSFVSALAAGELGVEGMRQLDLRRTADLLDTYPQIGFVDASLAAIAERLGIATLATTDRRHFAAIRPRHTAAFTLVP
jgi:predicted nucleic acid-binding protein